MHVTPLVGHYRQIFWSKDYRSLDESGGVSTRQDRRSLDWKLTGATAPLKTIPMARPPWLATHLPRLWDKVEATAQKGDAMIRFVRVTAAHRCR